MSLAVFILPQSELEIELTTWKQKIEKVYPNQPYTSHPPHLTLINLEVKNEKDAIEAVLSQAKYLAPFNISITHPAVFWDDVATRGHTLYLGLEKSNEIFALQQEKGVALNEIVIRPTAQPT